MKLINIKLPERDIEIIDSIVKISQSKEKLTSCKYDNRSDFIRVAINNLIEQERNTIIANKSQSSGGNLLMRPFDSPPMKAFNKLPGDSKSKKAKI
jgi:Arc/MetJ-type ribon-helix-helix transcriptional regulator